MFGLVCSLLMDNVSYLFFIGVSSWLGGGGMAMERGCMHALLLLDVSLLVWVLGEILVCVECGTVCVFECVIFRFQSFHSFTILSVHLSCAFPVLVLDVQSA